MANWAISAQLSAGDTKAPHTARGGGGRPATRKTTKFLSEAASSSAEVRSRRPTRLDTLKVGEIAQFADAALRRH